MKIKWIVIANSYKASFYSQDATKHTMPLQLVIELTHPESRLKTKDLTSGPPGHYKTSGDSRGTFSQETDPHDHEVAIFAKEIADALVKGFNAKHYDEITLVMPSHFYGLVAKELSGQVQHLVKQVVQKDYTHLPASELLKTLSANHSSGN